MTRQASIMWLIILGAAVAALVAGAIYMVIAVGRFGGIKALSGDKKWLRNLISFACIAAVFLIVSISLSPVNAAVVFLHEVLFFLAFGGIMRIVGHFTGKETAVYWQWWLAIGTSVIYLAVGYYLLHHVWQTDYSLKSEKPVSLKIAMFADSHIGTTFDGEGFAEHMKTIEAQHPDIVLLPGDFVDDGSKKADMLRACEALGKMNVKYGVWYSYGNHDEGLMNSRDFTAAELEQALRDNGIHILSDEYELVDDSFYVVGRKDSSLGERKNMDELLEGVDTSKYIIVLDHEPNDYDNEAASSADLVVSGHTHGGQLFPVTYVGELFGINDRTYGYENRNGTDFIVTSGISDWEIQFKTGTKSEYVIADVNR
ncbi:metallophosphoesterase [Ruminococcus sp.]|uniref:metallophosphoesterase n=1 Tax=Ruminococcus sp. TaxID=41978 RepID=UPI0025F13E51|nr:metallophosphoesterase [Ruminococcus sp.]MBQ8967260.1 metallophosphoesterase [Ruminococcus sp.]